MQAQHLPLLLPEVQAWMMLGRCTSCDRDMGALGTLGHDLWFLANTMPR